MRNLKKLLAVIVTIAMIATFAIPAFASSTAPAATVADADTKAAVERLSALGIVNGMGDGKFHEEFQLTREEFTKMLVVALGLNNAANTAKGTTKFSDVASDRWSSGFVNVGVSKGIIKGYSNGKFGPADKLTEAQAVTMLVRALGYRDEWLGGTMEDMINRADEVGMLDDVTLAGGICTRGTAALLLNNTLDCELVEQKGFGTDATWEVKDGSSVLKNKLGIDEIEGVVTKVPRTDDSLDADEIVFDPDEDAAGTYTIKEEGIDANSLLNKDVTILADGTDILYVSVDTDAENTIVGTLTVDGDTYTVTQLDGSDDDYDVASSAIDVTVDNEKVTGSNTTDSLEDGQFGTFILNDDGEIQSADVTAWEDSNSPVVVTTVDTTKEYIKGYKKSDDNVIKIDLTEDDGYVVEGAVSALADIKANDVVYYATGVNYNDGDAYTVVYVVRNAVTGELNRTNAAGDSLRIAGTDYDVDTATATVSLDNNDTINDLTKVNINDAIGENVTALLDITGQVRHVVATVEGDNASVIYGVVTKVDFTNAAGDSLIKIYNPATDASIIAVDEDDDYGAVAVGDAVAVKLDSDNVITDLDYLRANGAASTAVTAEIDVDYAAYVEVSDFNDDYNYMQVDLGEADESTLDSTKLYITSDTKIVDESSDPDVVSWSDIKAKEFAGKLNAMVFADGNKAKLVVFVDDTFSGIASDFTAAVVTDRYNDGDEQAVVTDFDGTSKTIELGAAAEDVAEGDVIIYSTDSDGAMDSVVRAVYDDVYSIDDVVAEFGQDGDFGLVAGTVADSDDESLTLNAIGLDDTSSATATTDYAVNSDAVVYLLSLDDGSYDTLEKVEMSEIEEGDNVRIVLNDDGEVAGIIIVREE